MTSCNSRCWAVDDAASCAAACAPVEEYRPHNLLRQVEPAALGYTDTPALEAAARRRATMTLPPVPRAIRCPAGRVTWHGCWHQRLARRTDHGTRRALAPTPAPEHVRRQQRRWQRPELWLPACWLQLRLGWRRQLPCGRGLRRIEAAAPPQHARPPRRPATGWARQVTTAARTQHAYAHAHAHDVPDVCGWPAAARQPWRRALLLAASQMPALRGRRPIPA